MTSFDVISFIRRITGIMKSGHSGTLDPLATGVLPVCIGRNATKVLEFMTGMGKSYRAEMTLGTETDTMDSEGKILSVSESRPDPGEIAKVLTRFRGDIEQVPPMYSAVKVNGRKLYELARKGETIERQPRKISISRIELIEISGDRVLFDVDCSSGTYIRTLCSDIGRMLGCGAYMSFLLRTAVGRYKLEDSVTLEEIKDAFSGGNTDSILMPPESALDSMIEFIPEDGDNIRFRNGLSINSSEILPEGVLVKVTDGTGKAVGIGKTVYRAHGTVCEIKPEKIFAI